MKKVLHIGLKSSTYSPEGMEKGFRAAGFTDYTFFDWQAVRLDCGILGCQSRMIGAAMQLEPDVVFLHLQNPSIMDQETATELAKCGFVVNYSFDCRVQTEMQWMYDLAPHIGLTLFSCEEDAANCKEGATAVMQSSCDMEWYKRLPLERTNDVVFIGGNYAPTNLVFPLAQQRAEMVKFLKAEIPTFHEYGMNWDVSQYINPQQEILLYNQAAIAINQNNFLRENYTSDRLWRAMACGTLVITSYFSGIEKIFIKGHHLNWFSTFGELKNLIEFYLKHPELREEVAQNGMNLVREEHRWKNRFEQMKTIIEKQKTLA
jgi:Glycosyl transferases group 1